MSKGEKRRLLRFTVDQVDRYLEGGGRQKPTKAQPLRQQENEGDDLFPEF